ncbi:Zinc finger protein [Fasciola gigantica]|uniref:Zinc finger protein n=1 Tax=Fasciola gigantica TaxID=46835 RepID=A0A504Z1Q6_FASGI|nr:Zinc finger protein [Fasciola gigantica]
MATTAPRFALAEIFLTPCQNDNYVCAYRNSQPRFKCVRCEKQFCTRIQFNRHIYYSHSERSFTCPEPDCCRSFTSRSHLRAHLLTHTPDRPYACDFEGCTYRARTAGRLFQHKVIHGEGRRFSCDYCDYSATTSSNLRRHARIHAGARPYLCPHCDHRTSTLDALKKHVLDSGCHPGLPLYVCPWCSETDAGSHTYARSSCVGFNASGLAWRHLTTEHQEKILNSDRFKSLGRSTGNILLEKTDFFYFLSYLKRDVTRLLGIYCPEVDSTQPPEGVPVRQPAVLSCHRRRKYDTSCNSDKLSKLNHLSEHPVVTASSDSVGKTVERPRTSLLPSVNHQTDIPGSVDDQLISQGSSILTTIGADFEVPNYTAKMPADNIGAMYHLVQLGSGALWSRDAFVSCSNKLSD